MLHVNREWLDYWLGQMMEDIVEVKAVDTEGEEWKGDLAKDLENNILSLIGMWHAEDVPKDRGLHTINFTSKALNNFAMTDSKEEPVFFVAEEGLWSRGRISLREGDLDGSL